MRDTAAAVPKAGQARVFPVAAGLFVIWGVALWLYNALFAKFAALFAFNFSQLAWTQAAFHITYALLAIPAVLFHRKFGYKLVGHRLELYAVPMTANDKAE